MQAWCCNCKSKQEMKDPIEGKTSRGVAMVKGSCSVCNTKMCKIGSNK